MVRPQTPHIYFTKDYALTEFCLSVKIIPRAPMYALQDFLAVDMSACDILSMNGNEYHPCFLLPSLIASWLQPFPGNIIPGFQFGSC